MHQSQIDGGGLSAASVGRLGQVCFLSNVRPSCGDVNRERKLSWAVVRAGRGALPFTIFVCVFACFTLYLSATLTSVLRRLSVGGCVCSGE